MKLKFLPPVSLFGKISVIISAGILLTAGLTLNIAFERTRSLYLEHYVTIGKAEMEYVKNTLLDLHTNIAFTCRNACLNNGVRALFTLSPNASSKELAANILAVSQHTNDLWNYQLLNETITAAVGLNGQTISSDGWGVRISTADFLATPLYDAYTSHPDLLQYVSLRESIMGSNRKQPSLVAVKRLKTPMGQTPFGLLLIQLNHAYLDSLCKPYRSSQSDFFITDSNGRILSGSPGESASAFPPFQTVLLQNGFSSSGISEHVKIGNSNAAVLYEQVPFMNVYLLKVIDKGKIADEFYSSISGSLLLIGLITAVILLLASVITGKVSRPLKRFTAQMLSCGGRQGVRLPVEGSRETRRLAKAYNQMADEIQCYNKRLMETEQKRHNAELMALQLQITPHFLYNTLASIKFLALRGDSDTAGSVITSLISILRNTVENTGQPVTVKKQMEDLKHYTDIMTLRYEHRISVFYVVHPDCFNALIPRLLLQPLVENAFYHAFDETGGYVKIFMAAKRSGRLICEIMDNGKGFEPSAALEKGDKGGNLKEAPPVKHIGLFNVRQRLSLLYGDNASLTVTSRPGLGTVIRIELPFRP